MATIVAEVGMFNPSAADSSLICIVDPYGRILDHNDAFSKILFFESSSPPTSLLEITPRAERAWLLERLKTEFNRETLNALNGNGALISLDWTLQRLNKNLLSIKSLVTPKVTPDYRKIAETSSGLTPTQQRILNMFIKAGGENVTREQITNEVWKGLSVHPKALNVHLTQIRKQLDGDGVQIINCTRGVWKMVSS